MTEDKDAGPGNGKFSRVARKFFGTGSCGVGTTDCASEKQPLNNGEDGAASGVGGGTARGGQGNEKMNDWFYLQHLADVLIAAAMRTGENDCTEVVVSLVWCKQVAGRLEEIASRMGKEAKDGNS
jgi:hypothetical protein